MDFVRHFFGGFSILHSVDFLSKLFGGFYVYSSVIQRRLVGKNTFKSV